jgi:hypothetical protein
MDVGEVLRSLWTYRGFDPSTVGQIVLRPRLVTCGFPVNPDGTPTYNMHKTWVADIYGIELGHTDTGGRDVYFSRCLGLVDDENGALYQLRYLP